MNGQRGLSPALITETDVIFLLIYLDVTNIYI